MVIASMTGMCHRALGFSDGGVLEQIWQNDVAPCENCTEIAMGEYHRDGTKKPFLLLHKSQTGEKEATAFVYLSFLGGDKYLIQSWFLPEIDEMHTSQAGILADIDPNKSRDLSLPLYEDLRETRFSPLFLNLAPYLQNRYTIEGSTRGVLEVILKKDENPEINAMRKLILPHKIELQVEEQGGQVAPTRVVMYRNGLEISTIKIQNALVNGRLRPFTMVLTSQGKKDEIWIDSWGIIPDSENDYFTRTGLGLGERSFPPRVREVVCPPHICKQ